MRNKYAAIVAAINKIAFQSMENEYRPCYINGRRALFHRWINSAHPVLPKGMDASNEKARFFQYRSTRALIEYEDGTLELAWPSDIRFADGGHFEQCVWLPIEELEVADAG